MSTRLKIIKQSNSSSNTSPPSTNSMSLSSLTEPFTGLSAPPTNNENEFTALVNPATLSFGASISYGSSDTSSSTNTNDTNDGNSTQPVGQAHPNLTYQYTNAETLSFKLIFDGTGALGLETKESGFVKKQIDHLKKVTYSYDGSEHQTSHLMVAWGSFTFYGKLKSMSISYKLFNLNGEALRAEVDLQFAGSTSPEEAQRLMNQSSPDLSHVRVIKAGDTLPLMCKRIYGDSAMYLEVARINGLVNFRNLKPGTEILFPPIKK